MSKTSKLDDHEDIFYTTLALRLHLFSISKHFEPKCSYRIFMKKMTRKEPDAQQRKNNVIL